MTHRNAVRDATLDTTAALVAEHGLASVTMSQIAKQNPVSAARRSTSTSPTSSRSWPHGTNGEIANHLHQLEQIRDRRHETRQSSLKRCLHGSRPDVTTAITTTEFGGTCCTAATTSSEPTSN